MAVAGESHRRSVEAVPLEITYCERGPYVLTVEKTRWRPALVRVWSAVKQSVVNRSIESRGA
jgi:hypothetical protein